MLPVDVSGGRLRRFRRLVVASVLAAVLAGCAGPPPDSSDQGLVLTSCRSDGVAARCGTLQAPENRTAATGRRIPIRVVVFPAVTQPREPDPIVWFAGGPGDSAVDTISRVRPLFASSTNRDLVFVEQRGTGASKLTCPAFPDPGMGTALQDGLRSCLQQVNADPASYTTAMSVDDVDEVLTDLHYSTADLVGISYGATAAQTFLVRHPDHVRTMTLLSGTLLDVPVFERMPHNAQLALDAVFAECAGEPACQQAFPHLAQDWATLWASVTHRPWVVPADRSPDGHETVLDADWVASGVHRLLTVASTHTQIPLLVHLLGSATDRVATILAIAEAMPPAPDPTTATPLLAYTTRCSEHWARDDPNEVSDPASFEYRTAVASARWWQQVCRSIPRAPEAVAPTPPTNSAVAVLALNGSVDPQDPPPNMAGARAVWPHSLELTVPGQGHDIDTGSGACDAAIVASFIRTGSPDGLDTRCLAALTPPSFALTLQDLRTS